MIFSQKKYPPSNEKMEDFRVLEITAFCPVMVLTDSPARTECPRRLLVTLHKRQHIVN
jgi:hypothetical protein